MNGGVGQKKAKEMRDLEWIRRSLGPFVRFVGIIIVIHIAYLGLLVWSGSAARFAVVAASFALVTREG